MNTEDKNQPTACGAVSDRQANKLAARPNLYELHERAARAAIAKAKGGAA